MSQQDVKRATRSTRRCACKLSHKLSGRNHAFTSQPAAAAAAHARAHAAGRAKFTCLSIFTLSASLQSCRIWRIVNTSLLLAAAGTLPGSKKLPLLKDMRRSSGLRCEDHACNAETQMETVCVTGCRITSAVDCISGKACAAAAACAARTRPATAGGKAKGCVYDWLPHW